MHVCVCVGTETARVVSWVGCWVSPQTLTASWILLMDHHGVVSAVVQVVSHLSQGRAPALSLCLVNQTLSHSPMSVVTSSNCW